VGVAILESGGDEIEEVLLSRPKNAMGRRANIAE
jgi:hypothetical protein